MIAQDELEAAALSYVISNVRGDIHPINPALFDIHPHSKMAQLVAGMEKPSLAECMALPDKELVMMGGVDYLLTIKDAWQAFGIGGADEIVRILQERAEARRVEKIALQIAGRSKHQEPYQDLVQALQTPGFTPKDTAITIGQAVEKANQFILDRMEGRARRIPIEVGGLGNEYEIAMGQLVVVGARAKAGKTAFSLQLALDLAAWGLPTCYFSLEMPSYQLGLRAITQIGGLPDNYLQQGSRMTKENYDLYSQAVGRLQGLNNQLEIVDSLSLDEELFSHIRQQASRGTKLFVVDYLGLVEPMKSRGTREMDIAYITRSLKRMAIRYDVCIIAVAQINRQSEMTSHRRPELHHLRDSGAIEADADLVILLWRELDEKRIPTPHGEIIVAANRHGGTGAYPVRLEHMRFVRDEM